MEIGPSFPKEEWPINIEKTWINTGWVDSKTLQTLALSQVSHGKIQTTWWAMQRWIIDRMHHPTYQLQLTSYFRQWKTALCKREASISLDLAVSPEKMSGLQQGNTSLFASSVHCAITIEKSLRLCYNPLRQYCQGTSGKCVQEIGIRPMAHSIPQAGFRTPHPTFFLYIYAF